MDGFALADPMDEELPAGHLVLVLVLVQSSAAQRSAGACTKGCPRPRCSPASDRRLGPACVHRTHPVPLRSRSEALRSRSAATAATAALVPHWDLSPPPSPPSCAIGRAHARPCAQAYRHSPRARRHRRLPAPRTEPARLRTRGPAMPAVSHVTALAATPYELGLAPPPYDGIQ